MFLFTNNCFGSLAREMNVKFLRYIANFVPSHKAVSEKDVSIFCSFIEKYKQCLVVTGAGISTESGIPDYRSEGVGLYASSKSRPVIYKDFLRDKEIRKRYWARNFMGWPQFSSKKPNLTHHALKRLEEQDLISYIVTQNVDRLHTKAGNFRVVELHGSAYDVKCLKCSYFIPRHKFQEELMLRNSLDTTSVTSVNPDGDVTLPEEMYKEFQVPPCPQCSGILKPDIVFFGDNVPLERTMKIKEMVRNCTSVLVFGSSLTVYSSYRIIVQASELKKPILIANIGPTRADDLAGVILNVRCGELFENALKLIT